MKYIAAISLAVIVFALTGCGAPRWVREGSDSFPRKRGEVFFTGYSGICELPEQAREKAYADAAENLTVWLMEGINPPDYFPAELKDEPGFRRIEEVFVGALMTRALAEMTSREWLADEYTRRRRDDLETRFEVWQIHRIHRADIAIFITSRPIRLELAAAIDEARIGSTDSARREITRNAEHILETIARQIRGLHQPAQPAAFR